MDQAIVETYSVATAVLALLAVADAPSKLKWTHFMLVIYFHVSCFNLCGNKRIAGFTKEEMPSFRTNFISRGFVDTFRKQHPDVIGCTYWGYRHGGHKTNKDWQLDYFLASESIADKVYDSYILPDVTGIDHCPIGLILTL
ncbi:hypothetical protein SLEP1_g55667 [Rubroshorea leprosula]|uniref:Uncharacterized protein n=1 Tax=Rubroshorea leprosula TaxID=152421 RepID=A0AAV5MG06_9ROSI|nr:hypothetical protein SLEP1_g55667 [Rubroshorea leprosula]